MLSIYVDFNGVKILIEVDFSSVKSLIEVDFCVFEWDDLSIESEK